MKSKVEFSLAVLCLCVTLQLVVGQKQRCNMPANAPEKIEKVINMCQDEIKIAILTEAIESLKSDVTTVQSTRRPKRETFSNEEKRIAGCLLQCVYRKMKAVDAFGFPTVEGLLRIYSEGVTDRGYYYTAMRAVQSCLAAAQEKHIVQIPFENGKTCDVAYDAFDCVSNEISEYCGQSP